MLLGYGDFTAVGVVNMDTVEVSPICPNCRIELTGTIAYCFICDKRGVCPACLLNHAPWERVWMELDYLREFYAHHIERMGNFTEKS